MNVSLTAPPERSSTRVYWICQIGGWGGYALVLAYTGTVYLGVPWWRALAEFAFLHGCALLFTHLLRNFMRRRQWETLHVLALAPRAALASVVIGAPLGVLNSMMAVSVMREPDVTIGEATFSPNAVLLLHVLNWCALIALWCVIYFVVVAGRRRRNAERRQSELARALELAELRLLKSQLNPHFLFNSLNSVRALIADDPQRAQEAVTQLARTLRYALTAGQEEYVTLERELEIVESYLGLESLRLGNRLTIERDIAHEARGVRIPAMLLLTLVENAIKHGIAELPRGGILRISAQARDATIVLQVENPRPLSGPAQRGDGIGLRNVAERLRLLFSHDASFELDLSESARAVARIQLPRRP